MQPSYCTHAQATLPAHSFTCARDPLAAISFSRRLHRKRTSEIHLSFEGAICLTNTLRARARETLFLHGHCYGPKCFWLNHSTPARKREQRTDRPLHAQTALSPSMGQLGANNPTRARRRLLNVSGTPKSPRFFALNRQSRACYYPRHKTLTNDCGLE